MQNRSKGLRGTEFSSPDNIVCVECGWFSGVVGLMQGSLGDSLTVELPADVIIQDS
jgi:hypothetical protein